VNAVLLERAERWLNELGIQTERVDTVLKVNRDNAAGFGEPDELLAELKKGLGTPRLFWTKDDNWLFLESY
jgi:predicted neuraminidase